MGGDILKMRGILVSIIFVIITIIFIILERFKFDLMIKIYAGNLGATLVSGNLIWLGHILYCLLGIGTIVYAVLSFKTLNWQALIPAVIFLSTVLYVYFYPMTDLYINQNYIKNAEDRIKTIEMLENHQLIEYQIGQGVYMVPYRATSHTGTMLVQERGGVTKVMFYAYRGLGASKVFVYVSDDSGIDSRDFNFGYSSYEQHFGEIKKMDNCWYSAIARVQ